MHATLTLKARRREHKRLSATLDRATDPNEVNLRRMKPRSQRALINLDLFCWANGWNFCPSQTTLVHPR